MELTKVGMGTISTSASCWTLVAQCGASRVPMRKQTPVPKPTANLLVAPQVYNRRLNCSRNSSSPRFLNGKVSNGSKWSAGIWLDQSAQVETRVPLEEAWALWEDREAVTQWMPWISSVKVQKDRPELSKWTLKWEVLGQNLEFSWMARSLQPIFHKKIHWRSVDGLPNRGAVRFFSRGPSACVVQLTISYEVPEQLAIFASTLAPVVENILKADLERFSAFAKKNRLKA